MPDQTRPKQTSFPTGNSAITWWSWRPGIKPRNAFIIGAPLTLLACFFIGVGLYTLLFGIIDSYSPPLQIPAFVTGYSSSILPICITFTHSSRLTLNTRQALK